MPTLVADESLIVTLVEHLVANALKFSSRPVKVSITAEQVDDTWILGVKDQGPGVDPRYVERIFRPFEPIGPQRNDSGSGMGLAICRAIVERHGGEIWVEPALDQGAHFKFHLDVMYRKKDRVAHVKETNKSGWLTGAILRELDGIVGRMLQNCAKAVVPTMNLRTCLNDWG